MLDKIVGLRKLIVSVIILGVACAAVYFKGDVPTGLVSVLGFIFAGFVVGNAVEHITDGSVEKANIAAAQPDPAAPQADLQTAITDMTAKIQQTSDGINTVQNALLYIMKKYNMMPDQTDGQPR